VSWFAGLNYNKQEENGNTYLYEMYGYILILLLLVLERKGQVWLTNKFGYEGSVYANFKGKIKLEQFISNLNAEESDKNVFVNKQKSRGQESEEVKRPLLDSVEEVKEGSDEEYMSLDGDVDEESKRSVNHGDCKWR
jgi:radical SAM superfamily enzyme YgiQ (UPF0313 family)